MEAILRLLAPIHRKFCSQKCDLFFDALKPRHGDSLLDVGGGTGILGEFGRTYQHFTVVQVVNLDPQVIQEKGLGHVKCDVADGCSLPFPDHSFDWVFSNAVTEHVRGAYRQQRFAEEIRRVARNGYFGATPDRYFPVDLCTLLPFYQFLSPEWQRRVCRSSPGYLRQYAPIDLLPVGALQALFPEATVRKIGLRIFSNNLVVYRCLESSS